MTKRLPFTQASIRRAINGARKAGLRVVAIGADGTLMVHDGDDLSGPLPCASNVSENASAPSKWEDKEE